MVEVEKEATWAAGEEAARPEAARVKEEAARAETARVGVRVGLVAARVAAEAAAAVKAMVAMAAQTRPMVEMEGSRTRWCPHRRHRWA